MFGSLNNGSCSEMIQKVEHSQRIYDRKVAPCHEKKSRTVLGPLIEFAVRFPLLPRYWFPHHWFSAFILCDADQLFKKLKKNKTISSLKIVKKTTK